MDNDEKLTVTQIATELGISPGTFRTYVKRTRDGKTGAPLPDGHFDKRTPYWLRSTIKAWRPDTKGGKGK